MLKTLSLSLLIAFLSANAAADLLPKNKKMSPRCQVTCKGRACANSCTKHRLA